MKPQDPLKFLATFVLMVVGGVVAFAATALSLIMLGDALHGNYEIYTEYPNSHGVALCFVIGALGFLAPGFISWKLHNFADYKLPSQFSLRNLLVATTIIAIVLGLAVFLYRTL
jgi:hypothetical protein